MINSTAPESTSSRIKPWGAATKSLRLSNSHFALEDASRLRVELIHLQLVFILEVAVPLLRRYVPDGLVSDGVHGGHGHQVLMAWPDNKSLGIPKKIVGLHVCCIFSLPFQTKQET